MDETLPKYPLAQRLVKDPIETSRSDEGKMLVLKLPLVDTRSVVASPKIVLPFTFNVLSTKTLDDEALPATDKEPAMVVVADPVTAKAVVVV